MQRASIRAGLGIFLISLSTLLFEILLSRIFSVSMWYHFAFLAISLAMFGMTAGALTVDLKKEQIAKQGFSALLFKYSWLFALASLLSVVAHAFLQILLSPLPQSLAWTCLVLASFPLLSLPFYMSGIVLALALSQYPSDIARLYAFDLAGAALACLLVVPLLSILDVFSALLFCGFIASIASFFYASEAMNPAGKKQAGLLCLVLGALACFQTYMQAGDYSPFRLHFAKEHMEPAAIYEKWNSFSRLKFFGTPDKPTPPACWGLSKTYGARNLVKQIHLEIDGAAATVLTNYKEGKNDDELAFLRFDICNLAHYLRSKANVLVVGVGGARDILSALMFQQASVTGVEINADILEALKTRFGEFTGHLDRQKNVHLINDEARSYISRSKNKYDIIQISLIDTWAATAAGGMSLTENSLYTKEAFTTFFDHLSTQGILSVTRWYAEPYPTELLKLVTLAREALLSSGVKDPSHNIMVAKSVLDPKGPLPAAVATVLISKEAFTEADREKLNAVCGVLEFEIVFPSPESRFQDFALASGRGQAAGQRNTNYDERKYDLRAPSDDCPYFFQLKSPARFLSELIRGKAWTNPFSEFQDHASAVGLLFELLLLVTLLNSIYIVYPLWRSAKNKKGAGENSSARLKDAALLCYFFSIGMGFMIIEIAQLQRLSIFLGHPIYSLTVLLFSLLLSGALGSFSTSKCLRESKIFDSIIRLALLPSICFTTAVFVPHLIQAFAGSQTITRILLSAALTMPMGFFMGMAFPLGMRELAGERSSLIPWLWGLNGAASVAASVLAVLMALSFGIQITFFCGACFYLLAFLSFLSIMAQAKSEASKKQELIS